MTSKELYEWAVREGVEDADLVVRDSYGSQTEYIEPNIVHHHHSNGSDYYEVEL